MAKLTFSEKQLIETVFEMESGYLLNFSNRTFKDFMEDVVEYDIYNKYPDLSKAKMLREFIKDESDSYVGKAVVLLINHMKDNDLIEEEKEEKVNKLYVIGKRLLGKTNNKEYKEKAKEVNHIVSIVDYDEVKKSLLKIEQITSAQKRGYEFEKFLNILFKFFNLDPHVSYRTEHDQIDGSFVYEGNTVLIEAKYRAKEIPKDDIILFRSKIESKSHFSRGLFITNSKFSDKALEYFRDSSSRIVVLTIEELFIMCERQISLIKILKDKFRVLDEKGEIYRHIMQL